MSVDYYALLGVPRFSATPDEIRRAYLEQIRFFHPDAGNVSPEIALEKTQLLNHIYDTLKDPIKRQQYDAMLREQSQAEPQAEPQSAPTASTEHTAPPKDPPEAVSRSGRIIVQVIIALFIIVVTAGLCFTFMGGSPGSTPAASAAPAAPSSTPRPTATPRPSPTPEPTVKPQPLPAPDSGEILYQSSLDCIAPFTIETSGSGYYLVKLRDPVTKSDVIRVFVHGGDTIHVEVPLGTFELVYATGSVWYGPHRLFGDRTECSKASDYFDFYEEDGYINGWTVTLYPVYDGNLETVSIDIDDFQ